LGRGGEPAEIENFARKEDMMSYLSEIYEESRQQFAELVKAHDGLALSCNRGAQRLIKLGIAIGLNSDGRVRSHAELMAFTTAVFRIMIAAVK
jgi:hypothetical protein